MSLVMWTTFSSLPDSFGELMALTTLRCRKVYTALVQDVGKDKLDTARFTKDMLVKDKLVSNKLVKNMFVKNIEAAIKAARAGSWT